MKILVLSALLAVSSLSFAQSQQAPTQTKTTQQKRELTPEDKAIRQLRLMTSKTNLTDAQTPEVKQILLARENEKEAARKANGGDKEKLKSSYKAINVKYDDKLQAALTPEQWKNWVTFREDFKKRREAKLAQNPNAAPADGQSETEDFY